MNKKAEILQKFIEDNDLNNLFTLRPAERCPENVAIFDASVEYKNIFYPLYVILDDSIYNLVRLEIGAGRFDETKKAEVLAVINELNAAYKCFKHYIMKDEDVDVIMLDICVPSPEETFNPAVLMYLIFDVLYPHTQEGLAPLIDVLGGVPEEVPPVEEAKLEPAPARKTTKSKSKK